MSAPILDPRYRVPPPEKRLTGSRCMCRGCGEYFNSTTVFDRHRVGPFAPINRPNTRRCLTAAEMTAKGWLLNGAGFWITAKRPAATVTARAGAAISLTRSPDSGGAP